MPDSPLSPVPSEVPSAAGVGITDEAAEVFWRAWVKVNAECFSSTEPPPEGRKFAVVEALTAVARLIAAPLHAVGETRTEWHYRYPDGESGVVVDDLDRLAAQIRDYAEKVGATVERRTVWVGPWETVNKEGEGQ